MPSLHAQWQLPAGPGSLRRVERPVVRRIESHFQGPRGHTLFRRVWLPAAEPDARAPAAAARRALVLVHGLFEHSGRYDAVAAWFAARGCAVHGYDQQGHGRSEGTRAHARRFADLLDDLEALLALVRAEHPGLPIFLLGHSLGGLVVAALLRERQPDVAGAITSGAALAISEGLSSARLLAARLLAWVAPRLSFDAGLDPQGLSRDPEVVRAYQEDPLVGRRITAALAAELQAAVRRTAAGAGEVKVPLLLLHGEEDPLCPVRGSADFHARLRAPGRLRTYPRLRHEILNEPERAAVFEDVLEWIRRLPARPAEAAA